MDVSIPADQRRRASRRQNRGNGQGDQRDNHFSELHPDVASNIVIGAYKFESGRSAGFYKGRICQWAFEYRSGAKASLIGINSRERTRRGSGFRHAQDR
jgi:hypothetical protein